MDQQTDIQQLAEILKALADPTRLKILALLQSRDCCVCELVPILQISQPAVSKHMARLKTSGFVHEQRKGQWVFYSLRREQLQSIAPALTALPDLSHEFEKLAQSGQLVNCD